MKAKWPAIGSDPRPDTYNQQTYCLQKFVVLIRSNLDTVESMDLMGQSFLKMENLSLIKSNFDRTESIF